MDAAKRESSGPANDAQIRCAWCGRPMFGEISMPGDRPGWCHDCSTTYGDIAVIVCNGCNSVVGGILPGPHESGYVIKKNDVLHTSICKRCHPEIDSCTVLEFKAAMDSKYGKAEKR